MKRLGSSDSLGALISTSPSTDEKNNNSTRRFQSMIDGLEEEDCLEETSEKKRRLSVGQVRALEKNFEVENKLEPDRKHKLAKQLNLQPRQVAVWFQNRRARWKTKQLERDYGFLEASYDDLKLRFVQLQQSKEHVLLELNKLKSKIKEENMESNTSVKDEILISEESEEHCKVDANHDEVQTNLEDNNGRVILMSGYVKDGSSDSSDSSAILNDDINNNYYSPTMAISSPTSAAICFQFTDSVSSNTQKDNSSQDQSHLQPTFVKMEEHNFFGGEESCDFFSDEQAPTLQWDCQEPWN